MAAVATEKVQSTALNLGFPEAYASYYKAHRNPERYFPTAAPVSQPYVGDASVNAIRLARKADADLMANAAVASRRTSDLRYTSTPHGRGLIPKPVLGQRKFANPETGAQSIYSARQDISSGPFHYVGASLDSLSGYTGGVLRTKQGQVYGKTKLMARIGQLDRIAADAQDVGKPPVRTTSGPVPGSHPGESEQLKIQLRLAIQQLTDVVDEAERAMAVDAADDSEEEEEEEGEESESDEESARSRRSRRNPGPGPTARKLNATVGNLSQFGFQQLYKIMSMLFVLAPSMDEDDLNDTATKISYIDEKFNDIVDLVAEAVRAGENVDVATENMLTISAILVRLKSYCDSMVDGVNRSDGERQILSKSLIKSLKFGKDLKRSGTPFLTGLVHPDEQDQIRLAQNAILAENPEYLGAGFSRRGEVREDSEQYNMERGDRSHFTPTPRDQFGYASGEWYKSNGRGDSAYFNQPVSRNVNGPGFEALKGSGKNNKPLAAHISKRYDKVTGGYNVAFC